MGGCLTPPPPRTSRFRNKLCKDDSVFFSRFLHAPTTVTRKQSSRIHRSLTGDIDSRLWHRVVVPACQATWLASRYVNPMPELTLSPTQGIVNLATGSTHPTSPPTLKVPSNDKGGSFLNKFQKIRQFYSTPLAKRWLFLVFQNKIAECLY